MSQLAYDAFRTLLVNAGLTVYDAESPLNIAGGFVTLYDDDGNRGQVDLADVNPIRWATIQATCNGDTAEQARLIAAKVKAAVEHVRPVVAGTSCGQIKQLINRQVERDDDVQPARFYKVSQWRWHFTEL